MAYRLSVWAKPFRCAELAKPNTTYAVISQRFKNWTFLRLLPAGMFDRFIAKHMGLKRLQSA